MAISWKLFSRKRGVVFTLMSVIVAFALVLTAHSQTQSYFAQESEIAITHVQATNNILLAFSSFAESALRTSTFNGLKNMSAILAVQNDPDMLLYYRNVDAFEDALRLCIFNASTAFSALGTQGEIITFADPCLTTGFTSLLNNFTWLVNDSLNVELLFTIDAASFTLSEQIPFEALAMVTLDITLRDSFANWTQENKIISALVPLEGLRDPMTSKFAANSTYSQPSFAPYMFTPTSIVSWNTSQLLSFVARKDYRYTPKAPSILGRYYANFSASTCCGVETVLNGSDLKSGPWPESFLGASSNYSFVDYELLVSQSNVSFLPKTYACDSGSSQTNSISGQENNFWLNRSVLGLYGVAGSDWVDCS